jgi:uncharacterized protein
MQPMQSHDRFYFILLPCTISTVVIGLISFVYYTRVTRIWAAFRARGILSTKLATTTTTTNNINMNINISRNDDTNTTATTTTTTTTTSSIIIRDIFIHPVKSLRPVRVSHCEVQERGLQHDRRLMLVIPYAGGSSKRTGATHRFLTQRQCPSLATIQATIIENHEKHHSHSITFDHYPFLPTFHSPEKKSSYTCADPPASTFTISLQHSPSMKLLRATVWDDLVTVHDMGDAVAAFFESIVSNDPQVPQELKNVSLSNNNNNNKRGTGVRLVQQANFCTRRVNDCWVVPGARTYWGDSPMTSLNDGFPVLVACESSLQELNTRIQQQQQQQHEKIASTTTETATTILPMSRFRPNIVLSGTIPFEEDTWRVLAITNPGETSVSCVLHILKACPRCKQSCTDQLTGVVHREPLATLASFRALSPTSPTDVFFAQNATVDATSVGAVIRVGATVQVIERGDPIWG